MSGGGPRSAIPPLPAPFSPQPTRVSGWRTRARAAPGGWRWRRGAPGGPCAPAAGTCLTPASCATTSAAEAPSPCCREALSARGRGRCGGTPSAAAGASGTRASAPWRCWGSPPVPPATPPPSTAQVRRAPAGETAEGPVGIPPGLVGEDAGPAGGAGGALAAPSEFRRRHRRGFSRRCRAPAAGGGGEPVRRAAGGDDEPRELGPCAGGAAGGGGWQRGVRAAGLWRAGEGVCGAAGLGLGGAAGAVVWRRREPQPVQRVGASQHGRQQRRGGGRRLLG